jgi:hypothetical protein
MRKASEHLRWIYERLEQVHGEPPAIDYMLRLDEIIKEVAATERLAENLDLILKLLKKRDGNASER